MYQWDLAASECFSNDNYNNFGGRPEVHLSCVLSTSASEENVKVLNTKPQILE